MSFSAELSSRENKSRWSMLNVYNCIVSIYTWLLLSTWEIDQLWQKQFGVTIKIDCGLKRKWEQSTEDNVDWQIYDRIFAGRADRSGLTTYWKSFNGVLYNWNEVFRRENRIRSKSLMKLTLEKKWFIETAEK